MGDSDNSHVILFVREREGGIFLSGGDIKYHLKMKLQRITDRKRANPHATFIIKNAKKKATVLHSIKKQKFDIHI